MHEEVSLDLLRQIFEILVKIYYMLSTIAPVVLNFFITPLGDTVGIEGFIEYTPLELLFGGGIIFALIGGIVAWVKNISTPIQPYTSTKKNEGGVLPPFLCLFRTDRLAL